MTPFTLCSTEVVWWYGDGVDNTFVENSSVFSLIWTCWLLSVRHETVLLYIVVVLF